MEMYFYLYWYFKNVKNSKMTKGPADNFKTPGNRSSCLIKYIYNAILSINKKVQPGVVMHTCSSNIWGAEQEDCCEF